MNTVLDIARYLFHARESAVDASHDESVMNTLIDVASLNALIEQGKCLIFDCRFSLADKQAGQRLYRESHLPGALRADLEHDLSAPHLPGHTGRHPLPLREAWLAKIKSWGLRPDTQVVAYDDAGGAIAARMWWMLRWAGHGEVAVLDGGWQAWLAAGHGVTSALPEPLPEGFDYSALPCLTSSVTAEAINAGRQCLLDARDPARFRGEVEPLDPVAGHIPGARCSSFAANLNNEGCFKSPKQLREKFAAVIGDVDDLPVVCYCGSGVTAAHNILAMKHAGLGEAMLYAGSWSEWITDASRPVATGDEG